MPGTLHPPRIFLQLEDAEMRASLEQELRGFPLAYESPPDVFHWPVNAMQLLDLKAAKALLDRFRGGPDPYMVLLSSAVVHPEPLPLETKAGLLQEGFSYVCDGPENIPGLKRRLLFAVRTRAHLTANQVVNERLRGRMEIQESQIGHQTDFLHMAVHDLRGPLAAMICYAELLMEGVLGNLQSSQLEPIRTIHRNCQFLIDMVNDLLDSARIGAGKLSLKLEKTNFTHEVENAVQSLRSLAETKGIQLKIETEPIPDLYLDQQKVGRILTNLLGNAIKFTRANGEIVLRVGTNHNSMVFSIQDMGPGISVADRKTIFESFNTGSGSNIPGKGHGLGLAICKSFVELHGGKILVESTRHKGSVFIVHLPLEKRRSSSAQRASRKVLVLDLAGDMPGLESLSTVSVPGFRCEVVRGNPDLSWEKLPPHDFLLVNENPRDHSFGGEYFLLRLAEEIGSSSQCGLLVSADAPESDKEIRRHFGFRILEKPCTPQDLFDKLQGLVGLDRRKRGDR